MLLSLYRSNMPEGVKAMLNAHRKARIISYGSESGGSSGWRRYRSICARSQLMKRASRSISFQHYMTRATGKISRLIKRNATRAIEASNNAHLEELLNGRTCALAWYLYARYGSFWLPAIVFLACTALGMSACRAMAIEAGRWATSRAYSPN